MDETVNDALRRITKGAAIFFFGTVSGMVISFFARVLVARYLSPSEFGILSLSLVVFMMATTISMFGIPDAMTRQASYFIGKGEVEKAKAIIKLSGLTVFLFSVLAASIMFYLSDHLAAIFKIPALSWTLKILSLAIPFAALRSYAISIFRVMERAEIKVIFGDIVPNSLRLFLVVLIILLGLSLYYIVWAYALAVIISSVILLIYSFSRVDLKNSKLNIGYLVVVLSFALPLLLQGVLGLIISWTDTLMVGYFMKASDVGLYSSAQPVASLMTVSLASIGFLYFPLVSRLYAGGRVKEAGRTYAVITKWLTSLTLPIFLIMFFFPKAVLWTIYGNKYIKAYEVLRILALGFFIPVMLGPNGLTLLSFGRTKEVTFSSLISAVSNFLLNLIAIPVMGIEGAAVASAVSYSVGSFFVSGLLYKDYKIHPFTKNYLKPAVMSVSLTAVIYLIARNFVLKWYSLIVLFILFLIIYFISLLFTRSFDKEDISLLLAIEQRLGLDLGWIKRVLRRFV